MARPIHKLVDTAIRKPNLKPGRHSDGGGLYLNVKPGGSKSWLFMYHYGGRRRVMGLGPYPALKLAAARDKAATLRQSVADGRDPLAQRQQEIAPTFAECAGHYVGTMEVQWRNSKHRAQWRMTLGPAYCQSILEKPVNAIDTADLLGILEPIWMTKQETASRLRGRIEHVLDYAKSKGWRSGENPARWRGHLKHLLPKARKLQRGHHAAMPYDAVPGFWRRLSTHDAMAARCLEFLVLTACRSGEALGATWQEVDLESRLWTIPGDRMKASKTHRIPLSEGAMGVLHPLAEARHGDLVFPGQKPGRPLSSMAMIMLMRRMREDRYTVHGFRSAFRDWAGDVTDHPREVAEGALAHISGDLTERAYRRGDALEKRRQLMEDWYGFIK